MNLEDQILLRGRNCNDLLFVLGLLIDIPRCVLIFCVYLAKGLEELHRGLESQTEKLFLKWKNSKSNEEKKVKI